MSDRQLATISTPGGEMDVLTLGKMLAESGYFQDARDAAQAVVKVLLGQEMGFKPIASMTGIHIIEGKPSVSASLMANAIKKSPKYDYRILRSDDEECTVVFIEDGKEVGQISFTAKEAWDRGISQMWDNKAGKWALKKNWRQFPGDMLFARVISRGQRRFCPDVFDGPVYTPDEMGADVDEDGNFYRPAQATVTSTVSREEAERAVDMAPDIPAGMGDLPDQGHEPPGEAPAPSAPSPDTLTEAQRGAILAIASKVFGRATKEEMAKHCDKPISQLTKAEASALIDKLRAMLPDTTQNQQPERTAPQEAPADDKQALRKAYEDAASEANKKQILMNDNKPWPELPADASLDVVRNGLTKVKAALSASREADARQQMAATSAPAIIPPAGQPGIGSDGVVRCNCGQEARRDEGKKGWVCGLPRGNGNCDFVLTDKAIKRRQDEAEQAARIAAEEAATTPPPAEPAGEDPADDEEFSGPGLQPWVKSVLATVTEINKEAGQVMLPMSAEHKPARMDAVNEWLMGKGQPPVESFKELPQKFAAPLCFALKKGTVKWGPAAAESE